MIVQILKCNFIIHNITNEFKMAYKHGFIHFPLK